MQQQHPLFFEQFLFGNHTVKSFQKKWVGISTDLSIEQILMKSLKGRVGVIGRGKSENILQVWTKTIHRCAEVKHAIGKFCFPTDHIDQHKELDSGHIKCENEEFEDFKGQGMI